VRKRRRLAFLIEHLQALPDCNQWQRGRREAWTKHKKMVTRSPRNASPNPLKQTAANDKRQGTTRNKFERTSKEVCLKSTGTSRRFALAETSPQDFT
jgi:hypothetical protein